MEKILYNIGMRQDQGTRHKLREDRNHDDKSISRHTHSINTHSIYQERSQVS